uniref:GmrSD restriction endonucleases N-terminal domain-containing protein n=1 Tax=Candidatus Kentrum sp. FM TaxID=2126340 RepID=A0A450VLB9_9GAMM|nr:MAG: Protein of unknown function DUF262 [Candidatus Kentron sp. FM]VFJ43545.1 MAG: Protein of unknown function DUF262 [Candidatus Kentron sp. FM]VFK05588.1 MAG: Protein of unknown function DUF262 [Candidatus Kentron sp. FM]
MNSNPNLDNTQLDDPQSEKIEGLGENEDSHWADYPIDTMLIRHDTRTVHDILRRIAKGSFIMNPDFQRDFIWPQDKQSKLIESVLMRIPLPVFYLGENQEGKMVVVDGLQRLYTFQNFVNNNLRLKLPHQPVLHKKRFKELSAKFQNRIEDCNLVLYVIDDKVPDRARLDIFERVNGGVPLTRQQMRNCLYSGDATRFLKEEANTEIFSGATGKSLNWKTMRDRELINRFCAFQLLSIDEYKSDMDDFLAEALKKMNGLGKDGLEKLSSEFRTALSNNFTVFGEHAFRKHTQGQEKRSVLNASLWDVMSTGLSRYSEQMVKERAQVLRNAFFHLMDCDDFIESITYGPNSTEKVRHRFSATQAMFREVFGDYPT